MPRVAKPERLHHNRWRARWHDHTGRRRSKVFHSYEEALGELRARQNEADEIRRGLRPKPPEDRSFKDLASYWETHVLPRKRSAKEDRSILRAHLKPSFGSLLLLASPLLRLQLADQWRKPGGSNQGARSYQPEDDRTLREHRWIPSTGTVSCLLHCDEITQDLEQHRGLPASSCSRFVVPPRPMSSA